MSPRAGMGVLQKSFIRAGIQTPDRMARNLLTTPTMLPRLLYTGLFEMIVGVLTTCHTQYTSDSSICIFLFNRTTLQVFVTYLTGALYVHPL